MLFKWNQILRINIVRKQEPSNQWQQLYLRCKSTVSYGNAISSLSLQWSLQGTPLCHVRLSKYRDVPKKWALRKGGIEVFPSQAQITFGSGVIVQRICYVECRGMRLARGKPRHFLRRTRDVTYVTLRSVRVTIVAVEKKYLLHILSVLLHP